MRIHRLSYLFAPRLLCLVLALATIHCASFAEDPPSADAEPSPVTTRVAVSANDWIVDSSSGRVFASVGENEVIEYDASGAEVRRFKVGADPTELLLKLDKLVVACTKSPALYVIDLGTNEVVGTVELTGKGPYALFCSQVDNDFVYCVCNTGSAWWDGEVFQCDLARMQIRKRVRTQSWGQSHVVHAAMSPDGNWLIPDARGASSPSGADLMKVDEDECEFVQVREHHASFGQIVAGPFNRFWTLGNALYPLNIAIKIRTFTGSPVALHPQFDLAASKTDASLVLERFSDASPIAEIPLVEENGTTGDTGSRRRSSSDRHPSMDPTVQYDLKHQLVFVGTPSSGYWIDLQPYSQQLSPLTLIQVPSEIRSLVDTPVRIPLKMTDGAAAKDARVVVTDGPEAVKVMGDQLQWKPTAADIGINTIQLALRSPDESEPLDAVELKIHVTLPRIELGFHAKTMKISPDGRYLAVWGLTPGEEDRHPAHSGSDDIAVIELSTGKVLVRKTLPQGLRCAEIDSNHLYLAPASGNLVYRFTHALTEGKRQFLQSAPEEMTKVGDDRLVIRCDQLQFFDTETMQPASTFDLPHRDEGLRLLGAHTLQLGDRILDRETGTMLRMIGAGGLPLLVDGANHMNHWHLERRDVRHGWGRKLVGNQLTNQQGSTITQWPNHVAAYAFARQWPIAVLISSAAAGRQIQTTMELRNLIDGSVEHTALLDLSPTNHAHDASFYGAQTNVLVQDRKVLYLHGRELLIATIPKSVAKAMPVPVHFLDAQQTLVEVEEKVSFSLAVGGERGARTFSLLAEYPGLSLDEQTGMLTVDTESMWSRFIERTAQESSHGVPHEHGRFEPLDQRDNAKAYEQLTGKPLPEGKLATSLPIAAALRDSEGQEDRIHFHVILLGPREPLETALAQQAQKQKELQRQAELARAQAEQARAAASAAREAADADRSDARSPRDRSVHERLDALEARVQGLEAMLREVLRLSKEK